MRSVVGALLLTSVTLGCDPASPDPMPPADPRPPATPPTVRHAPHSGRITGRVVWHGPPPSTLPPHSLPVRTLRPRSDGSFEWVVRPAPNFPSIDPTNGGLAGAVVFLRGVNPADVRPWDHPPVTVELHDERPMIRQGDGPLRNVGIIRRGDAITLVARQTRFHSVRARGAAFWSLTFPTADRPRTRWLDQPGLVELASGAGYYWMHGYLWVSDHPYFTVTDVAGRWELPAVPPGNYELVVWHPNWRVERLERDPESGSVARASFQPPVEQSQCVEVKDGEVIVGDVRIGAGP